MIDTTLGAIVQTLEWVREGVDLGELVVEECQKDIDVDRVVLRVSVRTGNNWKNVFGDT